MDEMKIQTKFLRRLIAKVIKRELKKKLGYDVQIDINTLTATVIDQKAHIHLDIDGEISTGDLEKLILG